MLCTLTFEFFISRQIPGNTIEEMSTNILVTGGSSSFPGLGERLQKDISNIMVPSPKVIVPTNHRYHAWSGASAYTTELNNGNKWITKEEYEEKGPVIVLEKC